MRYAGAKIVRPTCEEMMVELLTAKPAFPGLIEATQPSWTARDTTGSIDEGVEDDAAPDERRTP